MKVVLQSSPGSDAPRGVVNERSRAFDDVPVPPNGSSLNISRWYRMNGSPLRTIVKKWTGSSEPECPGALLWLPAPPTRPSYGTRVPGRAGMRSASLVSAAVLTLFTVPKPFRGHVGDIQRNAIESWRALRPSVQVVLVGDEDGVAEAARDAASTTSAISRATTEARRVSTARSPAWRRSRGTRCGA